MLCTTQEAGLAEWPVDNLPPVYRERVAAMDNRAARARTVAGLLLLRYGLADDAAWQRLGLSATGRPEIAGGLGFSISHSAALVGCALCDTADVGLDIEARRSDVSARLVERIATAEHDFFAAWCAREATVKASGRVGLARVRAIGLERCHARLDERDWPLRWLDLDDDYAACLAVAPEAAATLDAVECERVDARTLIGR